MAELTVSLVAPDREIWSGAAKFVVARTTEGEIGILPDHEPLLALLSEGAVVQIDTMDGQKIVAAVHGGFLSVDSNIVKILAQVSELGSDVDVTRAKAALEKARLTQDSKAAAAGRRAEARLKAAGALGI
jgi:F-type H+-transporting ATPase subunit epsilon